MKAFQVFVMLMLSLCAASVTGLEVQTNQVAKANAASSVSFDDEVTGGSRAILRKKCKGGSVYDKKKKKCVCNGGAKYSNKKCVCPVPATFSLKLKVCICPKGQYFDFFKKTCKRKPTSSPK